MDQTESPFQTIIRSFQSQDAKPLVALWNEALPSSQWWNQPEEVLDRKTAQKDNLIFVAEIAGAVVGGVNVGYDGIRGWIYNLAVLPDHRRCGIGRQLLAKAEAALLALGCPKVNLQVRSSNSEVLEFYQQCGYSAEDRASLGKVLPRELHALTDATIPAFPSKAAFSTNDQWSPNLYDRKHSFVWKFGASVIELLSPQPGERILDIGCGTGQLTAQIAETRASVVGLDHSPAMIEEARRLFPEVEFRLADAHAFHVDGLFDGVFSNAALHWIKDPEKAVGCIADALKTNRRMAVEFGGQGNVRYLSGAIEAASQSILGEVVSHPWYFPGIAKFASVLERHGLAVTQAAIIDRPTPLVGDDGLKNWVRMFGQHWLAQIPDAMHEHFLAEVEEIARPNLWRDSVWHADYRRIRVLARRT